MKLIVGIMALIVLLLTVQPAFSFLKTEQQTECSASCCGSEAELPMEDDPSDEPCSDFCNPFLKCGACATTTIEFLVYSMHNPVQELNKHVTSTQRVYSQFAPDFWQPPRIA